VTLRAKCFRDKRAIRLKSPYRQSLYYIMEIFLFTYYSNCVFSTFTTWYSCDESDFYSGGVQIRTSCSYWGALWFYVIFQTNPNIPLNS